MFEDEYTEFKKTTGEINEAMISIAAILNKHRLCVHTETLVGIVPSPKTRLNA